MYQFLNDFLVVLYTSCVIDLRSNTLRTLISLRLNLGVLHLESEVLVRSSKEAKTSHAVAANLLELELKKILIHKMETNLSIDTYGDTVTIKRPRDGADDDQEPSVGRDRGSKRRRLGKEPESI
ncbi:hypothetical protein Tco_0362437, partial [Tanacetum coccineum]